MSGEGLIIAWVLWVVGQRLVEALDRISDALSDEDEEGGDTTP